MKKYLFISLLALVLTSLLTVTALSNPIVKEDTDTSFSKTNNIETKFHNLKKEAESMLTNNGTKITVIDNNGTKLSFETKFVGNMIESSQIAGATPVRGCWWERTKFAYYYAQYKLGRRDDEFIDTLVKQYFDMEEACD